jgi:hypothetical protein
LEDLRSKDKRQDNKKIYDRTGGITPRWEELGENLEEL